LLLIFLFIAFAVITFLSTANLSHGFTDVDANKYFVVTVNAAAPAMADTIRTENYLYHDLCTNH